MAGVSLGGKVQMLMGAGLPNVTEGRGKMKFPLQFPRVFSE